jgi:hypothetical protein
MKMKKGTHHVGCLLGCGKEFDFILKFKREPFKGLNRE